MFPVRYKMNIVYLGKNQPLRGYKWATLFLKVIDMATWSSRFGDSRISDR
jgi:hypothetical protein